MPNDDAGKADLLDPLFSFHHAPRGEKKILWIVAASHAFDPTTLKPSLSIQIRAGHPVILWTKGKASAIEVGRPQRRQRLCLPHHQHRTKHHRHHPATCPRH
jgi:hypothetical protein